MERMFKTTFFAVQDSAIPKTKVSLSSVQTVAISATATVGFDAVEFDSGSDFAASTFTAPSDGFYMAVASIAYSAATATTMLKLGSAVKEQLTGQYARLNGFYKLSKGDKITVAVTNTSSSAAITVTGGSWLTVIKLA